MTEAKKSLKRTLIGKVVSDKRAKTVTVLVERRVKHALPKALPPALREETTWIDPLVWAREILKDQKSRRLGDVAAFFGIPLEQAHRAAGDAEATGRVLLALAPQPIGPHRILPRAAPRARPILFRRAPRVAKLGRHLQLGKATLGIRLGKRRRRPGTRRQGEDDKRARDHFTKRSGSARRFNSRARRRAVRAKTAAPAVCP